MTDQEFEQRIVAWARDRVGVDALIQIGSRADPKARIDAWSDWDFYLIARHPEELADGRWLQGIAPVWCAHAERTPRGVLKMSAVFAGGFEADFVLLKSWQMQLIFWAMRHPHHAGLMPARLRQGIVHARAFLRASATKVLVGGMAWEQRLTALSASWPESIFTAEDFSRHTAAFWQKAVWISKRVARPELRAAQHALHALAIDHVYVLLAEEAELQGRSSRAEARKSEQWLDERRLAQTAITAGPDQPILARALLAEMALFEEVSRSVAQSHGFSLPDDTAVAAWLRSELTPLAGPA